MNWKEENQVLYRKFSFKSFELAMDFMQKSSAEMTRLNHHAEWKNIYNTIEVWLCTHDAGNTVTDKDRLLANAMDTIFLAMNTRDL
ncbi:MAG: pterin-4-alpha-carbinolamine dehydratase [Flavobacteriales bacterium]|nr:pterin-4-alpha-carbinolamine dehydratase [Flavobacteriaceae bacterium]PHX91765.1 MAG: pterin-4-alpha-carbinolamine dehydratase [Flavobacteriales bacterium]